MAKLKGENGVGGRRDQALGPGYRISMWRGIPRVYAKGIHKKKKLSDKQLAAMRAFAALANVAKFVTPTDIEAAQRLSKGTQYLWRDLIYACTAGTLFHFTLANGKKVYSLAGRTTVSELLDAISQEPGSLLIRGDDWWDFILPGPDGYVLTSHGPDELPTWEPGGATGGGLSIATGTPEGSQTYAAATALTQYNPARDITLTGVQIVCEWTAGRTYVVKVGKQAGGVVTDILATCPTFTETNSNFSLRWFDLPVEVTFDAGETFFVSITRTDGNGNSNLRPRYITHEPQNLPQNGFEPSYYANTADLQVSQALTADGVRRYCIFPAWMV